MSMKGKALRFWNHTEDVRLIEAAMVNPTQPSPFWVDAWREFLGVLWAFRDVLSLSNARRLVCEDGASARGWWRKAVGRRE